MNEPNPITPAFPFKDRRTGLTLFGVFTVLLGGLCALFLPLMIFGQEMAERTTGVPADTRAVVPAVLMYGIMAVALVWLGIGSIMARRWARALLLIFSWTWLLMGVVMLVFMVVLMPMIMEAMQPPGQPPLPDVAKLIVAVVQFAVLSVMFLLLPAAWVLFYRSPHVQATCEAQDPVVRWTDSCPPQVLALSVWTALSVPMLMAMPLAYDSVLPCFGTFLSGWSGTVVYLLWSGLWGYAAWAIHKLKPVGWWLLTVSSCLLVVSHLITFSRHDVMELYRLMGYPPQQLAQLEKFSSVLSSTTMVWISLLFGVLFLGYMLQVKKHFRRPA